MKKAYDILNELAADEGVRAAVLVSDDGFPMERVIRDTNLHPDIVAAISRDAVAAARKMFAELDRGRFIQGILDYTNGSILIANLPNNAFLIIITGKGYNKQELWGSVVKRFRDLVSVI